MNLHFEADLWTKKLGPGHVWLYSYSRIGFEKLWVFKVRSLKVARYKKHPDSLPRKWSSPYMFGIRNMVFHVTESECSLSSLGDSLGIRAVCTHPSANRVYTIWRLTSLQFGARGEHVLMRLCAFNWNANKLTQQNFTICEVQRPVSFFHGDDNQHHPKFAQLKLRCKLSLTRRLAEAAWAKCPCYVDVDDKPHEPLTASWFESTWRICVSLIHHPTMSWKKQVADTTCSPMGFTIPISADLFVLGLGCRSHPRDTKVTPLVCWAPEVHKDFSSWHLCLQAIRNYIMAKKKCVHTTWRISYIYILYIYNIYDIHMCIMHSMHPASSTKHHDMYVSRTAMLTAGCPRNPLRVVL